jgi:hypothetical protein
MVIFEEEKEMRQAISLILMFILTGVVSAGTIRITLEDAGNQRLRVGYEVTSGSTLPVGFGLDIALINGATFQNVASASSYFPIYPSTVVILYGDITDYGTPVVPWGLGTSDVTIEMGVQGNPLYAPSDPRNFNGDTLIDNLDLEELVVDWLCQGTLSADLNGDDLVDFQDYGLFVDGRYDAPPTAMCELLLLELEGNGAMTTTVSISEDLIRGGIVDSKGAMFDVILPEPITVVVPEPATLLLLSLGGLVIRRLKFKI